MTPEELAARYDSVVFHHNTFEVSSEKVALGKDDARAWGVGALVEHDEKALFVRQREHWLLPGGMLEPGESHAEGAAREVEEETGIPVEIDDLAAIAVQTFTDGSESFEFYFATFRATPHHTEVAADPGLEDETIEAVAWLRETPEDTFDYDLVADLRAA
jgi:8-oxo-dGTP diphosphatase